MNLIDNLNIGFIAGYAAFWALMFLIVVLIGAWAFRTNHMGWKLARMTDQAIGACLLFFMLAFFSGLSWGITLLGKCVGN